MGVNHIHRSHHVIVFMLKNVAMPYVPPSVWPECYGDSQDFTGVGLNRVFPAFFTWWRRNGGSGVEQFSALFKTGCIKWAPVQYTEGDQMKMDGMCSACRIDDRPYFGRTDFRCFSDRIVPAFVVKKKDRSAVLILSSCQLQCSEVLYSFVFALKGKTPGILAFCFRLFGLTVL